MPGQWFIKRDGRTYGPMPTAKLKQLAKAGKLKLTDLVQKEGMSKFVPAGAVKGLFPDDSAIPPEGPPQPLSLDEEESAVSKVANKGIGNQRRSMRNVRHMWIGVGLAVVVIVVLGIGIGFVSKNRNGAKLEKLEGNQVTDPGPQLIDRRAEVTIGQKDINKNPDSIKSGDKEKDTTSKKEPTNGHQAVTFKDFSKIRLGDLEKIEVKDSYDFRTCIPIVGRDVRESGGSKMDLAYAVEYSGSVANPFAKQMIKFEKAWQSNDGKPILLNLKDKETVVEWRDGKAFFRVVKGEEINRQSLEFLKERFGDDNPDHTKSRVSLMRAFWPKQAVAMNESWPCDTELLAKEALSAFEGILVDPDQSSGHATLVSLYKLESVSYARFKFESKLAVLRSTSKNRTMTFNPPMHMRISGFYDVCIDGTTANATVDVKWSARGTAKVKDKNGESIIQMEIDCKNFAKYTLVSKK